MIFPFLTSHKRARQEEAARAERLRAAREEWQAAKAVLDATNPRDTRLCHERLKPVSQAAARLLALETGRARA